MNKLIVFIFIVILALTASTAYAHPPSDITINYDPAKKMLTAIITHPVSNPVSHFIRKIDVSLNGKEIIEHNITAQDNNTNQTVMYLIPDAKAGDLIGVEAYCSISGKLMREISIK